MKILIILIYTCLLIVPITSENDESDEFIPTSEWQTVREGQKIPTGLHVRLNLETGLREAKLLDKDEQISSTNEIISVPSESSTSSQEELSRQNLEKAFANLDLTKDDVQTDQIHTDEIRRKYRSYDELKKDFQSLDMKIQTDQEIIADLTEQLNKTDDNEHRTTILTDLEFYLHQYDNAILFSDMNGLDLLINLLNSTATNSDIRLLTCLALGAAFQGNPKVQLKALNLGLIQYFLRLLDHESDKIFLHRLLYTLSTLLRNFPQAQRNFLEHGGAELMVKLLDTNQKIANRVLTLINDLIVEKDQAMDSKRQVYADIDLRQQLVDHGICSRISLDSEQFDSIEKTIQCMVSLIDVCQQDFVKFKSRLNKFKTIYSNDESNLLNSIDILLENLQKKPSEDL